MRTIGAYKLGVAIDVTGDAAARSKLRLVDKSVGSLHHSFTDLNTSKGIGALAGSLTGLVGIASAVTAGIGTLITTGFALAKSASEWGSAVHDASEKTGVATEAISALKFQAEQSGGSLGDLEAGIKIFSKTVGDAARGSDEAADKLTRLGIKPQEALKDLEGALAKAFKTVSDAPEGIEQTNAALDAFGRSGANLIPTIRSFDGDLEGLIRRAKELGATLTKEDAQAADDFGDTLDTLTAQFKGVTFQIAREFMPEIQKGMQDVSQFVRENKETFKEWGTGIGDFVRGVRAIFDSEAATIIGWVVKISSYLNPFTQTIRAALWGLKQLGLASGDSSATPASTSPYDPQNRMKASQQASPMPAESYDYDMTGGTKGDSAEKSRKEAERRAQVASDARLDNLRTAEREAARVREESLGAVRKEYEQGAVDKQEFTTRAIAAERAYLNAIIASIQAERAEIRTRADETATVLAKEAALRERATQAQTEFRNRRQGLIDSADETELSRLQRFNAQRLEIAEQIDARELTAITDRAEQGHLLYTDAEDRRNAIVAGGLLRRFNALQEELAAVKGNAEKENEIQHELNLLSQEAATAKEDHERRKREAIKKTRDEEKERLEEEKERARILMEIQAEMAEQIDLDAIERQRSDREKQQAGLGGKLAGLVGSSVEEVNKIGAISVAFNNMEDMALGALSSMGQAVGDIVGQWTLMGDQADISIQKMTAAVLAGLAAQATSMAVFFTAMGVVSLTPWGAALFGPAAPWFQGALLMAGIAAGAAGLGRLTAGDAEGGAAGQSSAEANQQYSDPNNPANQFSRQSVSSSDASERFVEGSGMPYGQMASVLSALQDEISRLRSMSPGDVVTLGAPRAARAIAAANTAGLRGSSALVREQGLALNLA